MTFHLVSRLDREEIEAVLREMPVNAVNAIVEIALSLKKSEIDWQRSPDTMHSWIEGVSSGICAAIENIFPSLKEDEKYTDAIFAIFFTELQVQCPKNKLKELLKAHKEDQERCMSQDSRFTACVSLSNLRHEKEDQEQ